MSGTLFPFVRLARWRTESDPGSVGWHGDVKLGRRLRLGFHVYRHSGHLPDRWVFQPFAIYDRKATDV